MGDLEDDGTEVEADGEEPQVRRDLSLDRTILEVPEPITKNMDPLPGTSSSEMTSDMGLDLTMDGPMGDLSGSGRRRITVRPSMR